MVRPLFSLSAFAALTLIGGAAAAPVNLTSADWRLEGEAEFVDFEERPALKLGNGAAYIVGEEFSAGVVEFDMRITGERSFSGISFRGQDDRNYESFYIRGHQSGNPDACQYTPVFNGVPAWQIHAGEGFAAAFSYPMNAWFKVRFDLYQDSALVSINGKPVLHMPDLVMDARPGYFAFETTFAGAWFSNVAVTPIADYADPVERMPAVKLGDDYIRVWDVSQALSVADARAMAERGDGSGAETARVPVEANGVANLARAAVLDREKNAALARFSLNARKAGDARMAVAFSDAAEIYLNGRLLFRGNDAYQTRDYRFLGTVGFYDEIVLPLKRGRNDVSFVVSEGFGGWAAGARLVEADGVSILDGR